MQVEAPHHLPGTLTEFLRQYAMIVLSILTALAMEQAVVALHDAGAARESRVRIEAELSRDAADLRRCEQANAENVRVVTQSLKSIIALLKQGKPDQTKLLPIVMAAFEHFNVSSPDWQRDAWDAAIADQSATHLASTDLRHYAEIYVTARDLDATSQLLLGGEWLTRMASLRVDLALNQLDPHSMADMLARYLLAVGQMERSQKDLMELMAQRTRPYTDPS